MGQKASGQRAIGVAALRAFEPALRRYFRRRTSPAEIDDLVQEVFASLYARRSEVPVEDLQRYLFTVASHTLARQRRRPAFVELFDEEGDAADFSPERLVVGREDLSRTVAIISALPERTRRIFVLHRFEEMTYGRIAKDLGISVSAVEKHIMAALRALSSIVGED